MKTATGADADELRSEIARLKGETTGQPQPDAPSAQAAAQVQQSTQTQAAADAQAAQQSAEEQKKSAEEKKQQLTEELATIAKQELATGQGSLSGRSLSEQKMIEANPLNRAVEGYQSKGFSVQVIDARNSPTIPTAQGPVTFRGVVKTPTGDIYINDVGEVVANFSKESPLAEAELPPLPRQESPPALPELESESPPAIPELESESLSEPASVVSGSGTPKPGQLGTIMVGRRQTPYYDVKKTGSRITYFDDKGKEIKSFGQTPDSPTEPVEETGPTPTDSPVSPDANQMNPDANQYNRRANAASQLF